jgi:hypothetical protein
MTTPECKREVPRNQRVEESLPGYVCEVKR